MSTPRWRQLLDWLSRFAEAIETTPGEIQDQQLAALAKRVDCLDAELKALKVRVE